jgi:acetoacetyl-CoA synthetase
VRRRANTRPGPPPIQGQVLWTPPADVRERTEIGSYLGWLSRERGLDFADYDALWRWSVTDLEGFWSSIWDYFEIRAHTPYERVLGSRGMPGAEWFPGARLNYAEHLLGRDEDVGAVAVVALSQSRGPRELTFGDLREQVARARAGLRRLGVEPGDRVVAYLPNIPETLVAFLATASLGAIWATCPPEFGVRSVLHRLGQLEPKVLLAVAGYRWGDKLVDRREQVAAIREGLPGLEAVVHVPYAGGAGDELPDTRRWDELLQDEGPLEFESVLFAHPLYVLFSSGTTALPKAIVHGHGGILLEHLKKLHLHVDAQEQDHIFWFTTTGWMMWNFLVGALLTPAPIVLYDGSPGHPDMGVLWDLAEHAGITCFGTSASYVAACMKADVEPSLNRDLGRLRAVGSTGSPLSPEGFEWIYEQVGSDTWLFSTSGGTDLCTAFVGGVPLLPVYRGELQGRALGAAVYAFDEQGNSVVDQVGELVVTEPMPSMPLFLWGDDDGSLYRASYFEQYPGVWRHGDWIEITSRGTAVIYGRSDSTINRQGVRMGTSEIYRAVQAVPEVLDALVVDVPRPGTDGWMPLFVVLEQDVSLDERLTGEIKRRIREQCSPRHVPDEVFQVAEVPRTLSGKVLEVPVKRILTGTPPEQAASRDSLANPESLDYFVDLAGRLDERS